MSATITWSVTQMDCIPTDGSLTDVVIVVHWQCNGQQTANGNLYTASIYATCQLTQPDGSQFTPYADLTQDQVLGWVWASGVDKATIEAGVQQRLDNQIAPPVVTPPLPWAAPTA